MEGYSEEWQRPSTLPCHIASLRWSCHLTWSRSGCYRCLPSRPLPSKLAIWRKSCGFWWRFATDTPHRRTWRSCWYRCSCCDSECGLAFRQIATHLLDVQYPSCEKSIVLTTLAPDWEWSICFWFGIWAFGDHATRYHYGTPCLGTFKPYQFCIRRRLCSEPTNLSRRSAGRYGSISIPSHFDSTEWRRCQHQRFDFGSVPF